MINSRIKSLNIANENNLLSSTGLENQKSRVENPQSLVIGTKFCL
jgi:hypothetical protein